MKINSECIGEKEIIQFHKLTSDVVAAFFSL